MITTVTVKFENGAVWSIPAKVVAEHRAKYYAETDKDTTFEREVETAMSDGYALTDWAANNMYWADPQPHATMTIPPPAFAYGEDAYNNAKIDAR